jgi:hypothetical protein
MKSSVVWTFAVYLLGVILIGCSSTSSSRKNIYSEADPNKPLVDSKYSLTADRAKMDEARAAVPPEKKKENDELALILQLTAEVRKSPSDIRSEFDKVVHKKRELMDKDLRREREDFTKKEKKERDAFLKTQSDARESYNKEKHTRDEKAEFYKDQDGKRRDYFADERERRNDFESDIRDKRKNFDDYIREKNNEFNQEYRAYSRRYEEMKKAERAKKEETKTLNQSMAPKVEPFVSSEVSDFDREIEEAKMHQGSPLAPGE